MLYDTRMRKSVYLLYLIFLHVSMIFWWQRYLHFKCTYEEDSSKQKVSLWSQSDLPIRATLSHPSSSQSLPLGFLKVDICTSKMALPYTCSVIWNTFVSGEYWAFCFRQAYWDPGLATYSYDKTTWDLYISPAPAFVVCIWKWWFI